ncbi:MAG: radical SAM protein, partial [Halarsenatibacteraceae bacterium]
TIIIKTQLLLEFLELIKEEFPEVERITSYGSARYVNKKSAEELRSLREAGLTRIHTGMESGDGETLELINKGVTPEAIITAGRKVKEAGIELSQYYLVGVGGLALSEQHALNSARVLNQFEPEFIRLRTFIPIEGTKLYDLYRQGEFELLDGHQALEETRLLIKNLDVGSTLLSDHISNHWDIKGKLPDDRKEMLAEIDKALKVEIGQFRDPAQGHL